MKRNVTSDCKKSSIAVTRVNERNDNEGMRLEDDNQAENTLIAEAKNFAETSDVFDERWDKMQEAFLLIEECAEQIKPLVGHFIDARFSKEQQRTLRPFLYIAYTNPCAVWDESPFITFRIEDKNGKTKMIIRVLDNGAVGYSYWSGKKKRLVCDESLYFVEDNAPCLPNTLVKWSLFTMALQIVAPFTDDVIMDAFTLEKLCFDDEEV